MNNVRRPTSTTYYVQYMPTNEILGDELDYEEATECVRRYAEGMHEERAADIVVRVRRYVATDNL